MASTYSTNLKIELIANGEQSGAWGTTTNTNLGTAIEQAITGRGTANFTADADLTLTLTDSNASQTARNLYLNVTSGVSLSTTRNLIVPTINKQYIVRNATTGGQSIVVKTSAGTGVTVPNGAETLVFVDGTNVIPAIDYLPALGLGGNLNFSGTGLRITGNFGSGTVETRTLFQSSSANTQTNIVAVENGTTGTGGGAAQLVVADSNYGSSGTNYEAAAFSLIKNTELRISHAAVGTGSFRPITFYTGGSERIRIDTAGNINIPTLGARITGDFSNANRSNRLSFQSTSPNGPTEIQAIPNGTNLYASFTSYAASDITNVSYTTFGQLTPTEAGILAGRLGSGSFQNLAFFTGGAERLRIDTSGNVGIGGTPSVQLDVINGGNNGLRVRDSTVQLIAFASTLRTNSGVVGTTTNHPLILFQNNSEKAVIDTSGNLLVTGSGGLGYGAGSGGTASQPGQNSGNQAKNLAVTLNKPSGQISTGSASLAAGAVTFFDVNNSSVTGLDGVVLSFSNTNAVNYQIWSVVTTSKFTIILQNISGSSLAETLVINFQVIKGAAS